MVLEGNPVEVGQFFGLGLHLVQMVGALAIYLIGKGGVTLLEGVSLLLLAHTLLPIHVHRLH